MLAPVSEAHYGEEPLVRLDVACGRAGGPRSPRSSRRPRVADRLPAARHAGRGRSTPSRPGRGRPGLAFQQSLGLDVERLRPRSAVPSARAVARPRRLRGAPTCPGTTRSTTACWSRRCSAPAGPPGSPSSRESALLRLECSAGGRGGAVAPGRGGDACRPTRSCLAAGSAGPATLVGSAPGTRAAGAPGQGADPPAAAPRERARASAGPCGAWSTGGVYVVPREDGIGGGRGHRRGAGLRPHRPRPGPSTSCSRTPGAWCPGSTEYVLAETAVGLRPGSPDNAPHRGTATGVRRPARGHRPLPATGSSWPR